jgi:hypothetical protein
MVDDTTIVVVAPTSPMTLLLHHGLHVRFVASWATLPSDATNGRNQPLHLNLSTIHMLITLLLPYLLRITSITIPGRPITLLVSSNISISQLRTTMVRIRSMKEME